MFEIFCDGVIPASVKKRSQNHRRMSTIYWDCSLHDDLSLLIALVIADFHHLEGYVHLLVLI